MSIINNPPNIPISLPPNGPAGGDLNGTYPNPGVNFSIAHVATANQAVPSGTAGGDLTGTYPNPSIPGLIYISGLTTSGYVPYNGANNNVNLNNKQLSNVQKLGIGNNTPASLLHVSGTLPTLIIQDNSATGDSSNIKFIQNDLGAGGPFTASIAVSWWNPPGMAFTAPRDLPTRGFAFNSNSGTNRLFIDTSNGNTGISNSTPTHTLDIGTTHTNSTLALNGIQASITPGSGVIAIGDSSGTLNNWVATAHVSTANQAVPSGNAGGDLTGTYPNPTVAKVSGVPFYTKPTNGNILVANGSNFNSVPVSGDATINSNNAVVVVPNESFDLKNIIPSGSIIGNDLHISLVTKDGTPFSTTNQAAISFLTQSNISINYGKYITFNKGSYGSNDTVVLASGSTLGLDTQAPNYIYVYLANIDNVNETAIAVSSSAFDEGTYQNILGGYASSGVAISGLQLYGNSTKLSYPIRYIGRIQASGDASGSWNSILGISPAFPSTVPQGIATPSTSCNVPNVVLAGKSLGGGTTVTCLVANGVANISHVAHNYQVGDIVVITGGTGVPTGDFNTLHVITAVPSVNTYQFTTTAGNGSITGTIKEMFWFKGTRSMGADLIANVTRSTNGKYNLVFSNTQPDAFYGISVSASNTGTQNLSGAAIQGTTNAPSTTGVGIMLSNNTGTSIIDADAYLLVLMSGII